MLEHIIHTVLFQPSHLELIIIRPVVFEVVSSVLPEASLEAASPVFPAALFEVASKALMVLNSGIVNPFPWSSTPPPRDLVNVQDFGCNATSVIANLWSAVWRDLICMAKMNDPTEVIVFTRARSSCHATAELLAQSNRFVGLGSRLTDESLQQMVGKADIWLHPHQKEEFEIMSLPSYDLVYLGGTGSLISTEQPSAASFLSSSLLILP